MKVIDMIHMIWIMTMPLVPQDINVLDVGELHHVIGPLADDSFGVVVYTGGDTRVSMYKYDGTFAGDAHRSGDVSVLGFDSSGRVSFSHDLPEKFGVDTSQNHHWARMPIVRNGYIIRAMRPDTWVVTLPNGEDVKVRETLRSGQYDIDVSNNALLFIRGGGELVRIPLDSRGKVKSVALRASDGSPVDVGRRNLSLRAIGLDKLVFLVDVSVFSIEARGNPPRVSLRRGYVAARNEEIGVGILDLQSGAVSLLAILELEIPNACVISAPAHWEALVPSADGRRVVIAIGSRIVVLSIPTQERPPIL